jgi:hypothetical protein
VTALQQLSSIIRNQAKLMAVPELVPDNRVLSLAIEISSTLSQLIAVRFSEGYAPEQANWRRGILRSFAGHSASM